MSGRLRTASSLAYRFQLHDEISLGRRSWVFGKAGWAFLGQLRRYDAMNEAWRQTLRVSKNGRGSRGHLRPDYRGSRGETRDPTTKSDAGGTPASEYV